MIDLGRFDEIQRQMALRIAESSPKDLQAFLLLKWALARITFVYPNDEPCAQVIRSFLDDGRLDPKDFKS